MAGRNLFADQPRGRNLFAAQAAIPQPQPAQPVNMSWGDVATQAISNVPSSAVNMVDDIVTAVTSPKETAKAVGNLALGVVQKAIPGRQDSEKYADTVGQFLTDRYGGAENIKQTIATDPVGFLADVSTILTAGGVLAARALGVAGKVGKVAQTTGRAIDPLSALGNAAVKGTRAAGKGTSVVAGLLSGAGNAPIREAYSAGKAGGKAREAFTRNLRGGDSAAYDLVDDARSALQQMRQAKSQAYRSGMADISKDKTILDFGDIEKAYNDAFEANTFNGVAKSEGAKKALDAIKQEIDMWKAQPAETFRTPEGIDALKQRIGDLADWNNRTAKENQAIMSMYNSVKGVIEKQAPTYSRVMKGYSEASDKIKEIERALSLGERASVDTALRKLTSVMRNNVNANFGERARLAEQLQTASGMPLMPSVAGQALSSITPRGMSQLTTQAVLTGTAGALLSPYAYATLPLQSPRVMGEAALAAGRASRGISPLIEGAGVVGRVGSRPAIYGGRLSQALQEE